MTIPLDFEVASNTKMEETHYTPKVCKYESNPNERIPDPRRTGPFFKDLPHTHNMNTKKHVRTTSVDVRAKNLHMGGFTVGNRNTFARYIILCVI